MFFKEFILPPGGLILLFLSGILLLKRKPRVGKILLIVSLSLFYLFSTPYIGNLLVHSLEFTPVSNLKTLPKEGEMIVVLGAGMYPNAAEYGGPAINGGALERIRYASYLQRRIKKPILITGGKTIHPTVSEAFVMKESLENDFKATKITVEEESLNTYQNALYSSKLLKAKGIHRIYLVTSAFHMPRAQLLFEKSGLEVIPMPLAFSDQSESNFSLENFLPISFWPVRQAMQEWIQILMSRSKMDPF